MIAGRLPDTVVPSEYTLEVTPNWDTFTFSGSLTIAAKVVTETSSITLNAQKIAVFSATATPEGKQKLAATEMHYHIGNSSLTMDFAEPLPVGQVTFDIRYQGDWGGDKMDGLYRSAYKNLAGEKKYMATTQCEPISARAILPCWDEPALKAVFNVAIVCDASLTALSNMPEKSSELLPGGKKRVTFLPTPIMSSYLLAMCIAEFDFEQKQTKNGTLIRTLATVGKAHKASFALECALRVLEFYEDYFKIPYPLPKLDMVAVPDFMAGAMENWGLVTYREVDLLCDLGNVSAATKERIFMIVAHELAHQWFGNLVTMRWWDDLWLNESFATFMQVLCMAELEPGLSMWPGFIAGAQTHALRLDGLRSSHPIAVHLERAENVDEIFDHISYYKGASTVRLVHSFIGAEAFRSGLAKYLDTFKHKNTVTKDLWNAWTESSGRDVAKMMGTWTGQMGFPLLRVSEASPGKLKVQQSYFVADGSVEEGDAAKTWVLPVFIGGRNQTEPTSSLMETKEATFDGPTQGWIKLNYQQHVPLRVHYSDELFARLCASVHELQAEDRIGLLSDTLALAKATHYCPSRVLTLLEGFLPRDGHTETSSKVWEMLRAVLAEMKKFLQGAAAEKPSAGVTAAMARLKRVASGLIGPCLSTVGWDIQPDDGANTRSLRATLVALTASFSSDDEGVQKEARRRFDAFLADRDSQLLHSDLRVPVLSIFAEQGGEAAFSRLVQLHNSTDDGHLKKQCYQGMAAGPTDVKKKVCEWALGGDVRAQDVIYPFASVAGSQSFGGGAQVGFDCVKENYERIMELLGPSAMLFAHFVKVVSPFLSKSKAEEVREFWSSKKLPHIENTVKQTVEDICNSDLFLKTVIAAAEAGKMS